MWSETSKYAYVSKSVIRFLKLLVKVCGKTLITQLTIAIETGIIYMHLPFLAPLSDNAEDRQT